MLSASPMHSRFPYGEAPAAPHGAKRVLLDTNIWRYVLDNRAQGQLLRLARDSAYHVQIAPGVLYETLRLKNAKLRDSLVRLMTNQRFHRLMPEAYSESMELLHEVERVRPEWLRTSPDVAFFNRLKKDWTRKTGGFWVRCARSPRSEANFLTQVEGRMIEGAKAEVQNARKEMMHLGWKRNPSMNKTLGGFNEPRPGWRGDMVEAWRIDCWFGLSYGLSQRGNAYRDWVAPFVDVDDGLLRSPEWLEFWHYLADKNAMPRHWMRWAHSFAQRFRTVTSGSPGDSQLSTYFIETDIFVTADKTLIDILEECRPFAPQQLPEAMLVPAGPTGVEIILSKMST